MGVARLVEILHQRLEQPNINLELFKRFSEVQNFIDIFQLDHPFRNKLILLIALLDLLEILAQIVLVDRLIHGF